MDLRKNEERFACTNAQHSLTLKSNKLAIKLPAAYQVGDATRLSVPIRVRLVRQMRSYILRLK